MQGLKRLVMLGGTAGGITDPNLRLNFLNEGYSVAETRYTFDQLIDFTRTSAATFVNSSGNIASTPKSRNLLTFTQEFDNAAWVKASATVTANTTLAPNATNTADSLISTVGTGEQRVYRESLIPSTAGITYTFSVYAKANGANWLVVRDDWRGFADTSFDLVNGVVGTVASGRTAIITAAGNGWYRCSVTATVNASFVNGSVSLCLADADNGRASFSGNGTKAMFIWGAQLEQASSATDYTRNFGGLFPPRFDYDPVTRAPRGLLIEEQRTNLLTYSEQFDNAAWTKLNATVTANATTSPDGTLTADALIENTANTQHQTFQAATLTASPYTWTIYAKQGPGAKRWLNMYPQGVGVNAFAIFDLTLGTVTSTGLAQFLSATITPTGNGWYRCAISFTGAAVAVNFVSYLSNALNAQAPSYTGDGTSGIFLWGAQLEAGAFATSYIPTVASQVTRTADVAAINAPNFASWYNPVAGTFVAEFDTTALRVGGTTVYNAVSADAGGTPNQICLYAYANFAAGRVVTGSATQADINGGGSPANNVTIKAGIAYASNDVAVTVNGATPGTDTSVSLPTVDRLSIGQVGSTNQLNGHIRSIRYYPTKLSNAQLQALTA